MSIINENVKIVLSSFLASLICTVCIANGGNIKETNAELKKQISRLPEDTTPVLTVKTVRISGNSLISTGTLLEKMPLIYNASTEPSRRVESQHLYDFRVLREVLNNPGPPRQITARTAEGFTKYILYVYQKMNFAGIYVFVPSETMVDNEFVDNILSIEILEVPVSDVTTSFYDTEKKKVEKGYLSKSIIQKWSPVKPGEVANKKKVDNLVNLLNLNPDRYVSAVVSKGEDPKSLELSYEVYEANPWHWFIQVDNAGTKDRQWNPRIGLINTNLLGMDDTFSVVYQTPLEKGMEDTYSVYGSYDFPLMGPRLRLNLYAGYSQYDVTPATGGISFIGNGSFYGGILRYNLFQTKGWFFDITGSLSHERSKVTPSLFPSILGTDIKMNIIGWGLDLHRKNDMSNSYITFTRVQNIGGSGSDEFMMARTNADRHFSIRTLAVGHSRFLDKNKVQRLSGTFRWISPSERLAPAKMTTFGGLYTVRGYEEDEIVADGGILLSFQYEFDLVRSDQSKELIQPNPEKTKKPFLRKLAPAAFFDYGRAKIENPIDGEQRDTTLSSVGPGLITELGDNFSGAMYSGIPLKATNDTDNGSGRMNYTFLWRW